MKIVDALLAPLAWFDIHEYTDGTPVTQRDRLIYRALSVVIVLAVATLVSVVAFPSLF